MNASIPTLRWILGLAALASAPACSGGADPPGEGAFRWRIATAIEIDAPPARVWEVLIDLPAYSEWNPFIVEAAGEVAVGETLTLHMKLADREPMRIEPRLLAVEPGRELRWKGRLFVPGLFDGEHSFALTPLEGGRTRLDHSERFAGLLLPIARGVIYADTVEAFRALDAALARRAEAGEPALAEATAAP
jgi:hypothetical protein